MKKYAGIGSRKVPDDIGELMTKISERLSEKGYSLRSGSAKGSDSFFEKGVKLSVNDGKPTYNKEIFTAYNCTKKAILMASNYHPGFHNCNDFIKKLHGRNAMIILGKDLNEPVEFVVCWTENGKDSGGTGLGIRLAEDKKIKVYNLFFEDVRKKFEKWLLKK
mgnify:FL=1